MYPCMARSLRLFPHRRPSGTWPLWLAAPALAGATAIVYLTRISRSRRSNTIIQDPLPQTENDDSEAWEPLEPLPVVEEKVSPEVKPVLVQLEANLADANEDEEIVKERSQVRAPVEFVRHLLTLPAPEIDAPHKSVYFLRPSTWHLPTRLGFDRINKRNLMAGLADSSRILGRHPVLNGLALFLTATLVAYVLAGGMRRNKQETRVSHQISSSQSSTASTSALPGTPYAVSTPPMVERQAEPPPPAEGPASDLSAPPPSDVKSNTTSKSNHRVAHVRRTRRGVTSLDKARAFFRKLF